MTDPSGAVVSNTRLTITSDNGAARTVTTDAQGRWSIRPRELVEPPNGHFKAKAEMAGFQDEHFQCH